MEEEKTKSKLSRKQVIGIILILVAVFYAAFNYYYYYYQVKTDDIIMTDFIVNGESFVQTKLDITNHDANISRLDDTLYKQKIDFINYISNYSNIKSLVVVSNKGNFSIGGVKRAFNGTKLITINNYTRFNYDEVMFYRLGISKYRIEYIGFEQNSILNSIEKRQIILVKSKFDSNGDELIFITPQKIDEYYIIQQNRTNLIEHAVVKNENKGE